MSKERAGLLQDYLLPVPRCVLENMAGILGPGSSAARLLEGASEEAAFYMDSFTGEFVVVEPEAAEA